MIIFKKIRWKNLFSTGNVFTEIDLIKSKSTLIVGKNGSGKSTLLDAMTFGLYGKPFRNINKPILVNSINGRECVVEIEFTSHNKEYKVVRGIKPNIFEIYESGKLINQTTSTSEYQEHLENVILKTNLKTFTQIVILGNASFKPFMQLPPASRREIIEDLLDIQIFSTMNIVAKQKLQINKEEFEKNRIKSTTVENSIRMLTKTISDLEKVDSNFEEKKQSKIISLKNDIEYERRKIDECMKLEPKILSLKETYKQIRKKVYDYQYMHSQIKVNLEKHTHNHDFYQNNDTCPTCSQAIESVFKQSMITEADFKISEYSDGLSKITDKITEFKRQEKTIEDELHELNMIYGGLENYQTYLDRYIYQLNELEKPTTIEDVSVILIETKKNLEKVQNELASLEQEKNNLLDDRQYLELCVSLLKDGGIKTRIIKQYLPIINKYINKYLQLMDLYINFEMNENFEETIKSRYRDEFLYDSFSEGEKMRINLAILFTWRMIAKLKNSVSTNLLIMDEIFDSSLDGEGTDEFLKIINGLTEENNTFIISHKRDQLLEKFDQVIKFVKEKDFSRIE